MLCAIRISDHWLKFQPNLSTGSNGEGALFASERVQLISLLRKIFIIFNFQNNNSIKLNLVSRDGPVDFTNYSTIFIAQ